MKHPEIPEGPSPRPAARRRRRPCPSVAIPLISHPRSSASICGYFLVRMSNRRRTRINADTKLYCHRPTPPPRATCPWLIPQPAARRRRRPCPSVANLSAPPIPFCAFCAFLWPLFRRHPDQPQEAQNAQEKRNGTMRDTFVVTPDSPRSLRPTEPIAARGRSDGPASTAAGCAARQGPRATYRSLVSACPVREVA